MKKKGYFFTLDVAIAMVIIVIGFLLIWSFYTFQVKKTQPYFYAQDILDFMSSTSISAVSGSIPYVQDLIFDKNITNFDVTLLEQVAIFYMAEPDRPAPSYLPQNFTRHMLQGTVPEQYSMQLIFNNTPIYTMNGSANVAQNESSTLISAKKMVVVVVGQTNLSDPYMMEVRVWR
jgi:hypothetical protein